ncbi:MAG: VOC family protein [Paenibacillaceae bacterium]|nr:VOC family protein [Paenibacillaceae bacterium]
MKFLIGEIHYNDIPVSDLQRSLDWYQRHLGFEPGFKNESMVVMKLPSGPLLILNQSDSSARAVWSNEGITRPIIGFTKYAIIRLAIVARFVNSPLIEGFFCLSDNVYDNILIELENS